MDDGDHWGWRQTWKLSLRRAQAGRPYKWPWWADEQIYGLAYLQGKGVEIPKDPYGRSPSAPARPGNRR